MDFCSGAGRIAGGAKLVARGHDRRIGRSNPPFWKATWRICEVSQVGKNLADEIRAAQTALAVSNKIAGTVLDLRFADGDDLDSAKAAADLFASKKLPLAILVNGQTSGAAATLAAELREARAGLIFESVAGPAQTNRETAALARRTSLWPSARRTNAPSWKIPTRCQRRTKPTRPAATNNLLPFVDHTSEADLVRAKIKDGDEIEPSAAAANRAAKTLHSRPGFGAGGGFDQGAGHRACAAFLISG